MGGTFSCRVHFPDPGLYCQPVGHPDTPAEARIDSLFSVHASSLDMTVRRETYREMSRILNQQSS